MVFSRIVDALVVVCARSAGQAVITSEPEDLGRIAPESRLKGGGRRACLSHAGFRAMGIH